VIAMPLFFAKEITNARAFDFTFVMSFAAANVKGAWRGAKRNCRFFPFYFGVSFSNYQYCVTA